MINKSRIVFFVLLVIFFTSCSSNVNDNLETSMLEPSTTTTILEPPLATSTTTTLVKVDQCVEADNKSIDFKSIRNVQKFLNNNGFNAGDIDGYLGEQTIAAIRAFQEYAGIYPDGDVGPLTREVMNNWTGCESKAVSIAPTTTTAVTQPGESSATTSTSTTTTIPDQNTSIFVSDQFGYAPSVSLIDNNIISVFKSVENSNSVCGTPYYTNLPAGVVNRYSNGEIEIPNTFNAPLDESGAITYIESITSSDIKIAVDGNGDRNYNFFFVAPFSSKITSITPNKINVSSGLTEAVFSKDLFKSGYWFYSFAENGTGDIVKSSGLREFGINPSSNQNRDSQNTVELINITSNNQEIVYGGSISKNATIEISYLTDEVSNTKNDTSNLINSDDQTITLSNNEQANINEILLIGNELMLVKSKNGNEYTVDRGYLNTIPKLHESGSSVKKIESITDTPLIADFAYAVIRNDLGLRFQLPLGSELQVQEFNLNGCPNGRYSLEEITTFAWREKGLSVVSSSTNRNTSSALSNKEFVISDSNFTYQAPSLLAYDQDTNGFINDGPRDITVSEGDRVLFDFTGLTKGTSDIKFVKLNFQLIPTDSLKLSKSKSVIKEVINGSYIFSLSFDTLINSKTNSSNIWEKGYKYIFTSIDVYDKASVTTFTNNREIKYGTNLPQGEHEAYYLDQFSFFTPNE